MKNFGHILQSLAPVVQEIASIAGLPGVSVGVLHENEVVYRDNFGYRNVDSKTPPDSDTLYPIASLTKAFTAATIGSIVEDGILSWDKPVHHVLPDFRSGHNEIQDLASVLELLSMGSGLTGDESLWFEAPSWLNDSQVFRTFGSLPQIQPFQRSIQYNNLGYAVASALIEQFTALTLDENLRRRILEPLGITRTTFDIKNLTTDNTAKTYMTLNDGTPYYFAQKDIDGTSWLAGAGGLQSSINDLLVFYKALLESSEIQSRDGTTSDSSSPLKQATKLLTGHDFLGNQQSTDREQTYALGWVRTQLPGKLGAIGYNEYFVENMPVAGTGSSPRWAIYHQGNLPGGTAAAYLFPETKSAVVVLANSFGLTDGPDWIAQLLIENLFGDTTGADYVALAREAVQRALEGSAKMDQDLSPMQGRKTNPQGIHNLTGRYHNSVGNFFLDIVVIEDELTIAFQGLELETYALKHFHDNVFSWYTSSDDLSKHGRYPWFGASYYLLEFHPENSSLIWQNDGSFPSGNIFTKSFAASLLQLPKQGFWPSPVPWQSILLNLALLLIVLFGNKYLFRGQASAASFLPGFSF